MCTNEVSIRCLHAGRKLYHQLGLKHPLLFSLYFTYLVVGATIFFIIEHEPARAFYDDWLERIETNRDAFLRDQLLPRVFNNSRFLVFLNMDKTEGIRDVMNGLIADYEKTLDVRPPMPRYEWTFKNSLLYVCSLLTTIGYGHIYPMTRPGKIVSMIYAVFGIPFTLVILQDLAGLLAKLLNYPGLILGRCWEVFRFCTLPAVSQEKLHMAVEKSKYAEKRKLEGTGGVGGEEKRRPKRRKLIFETILNTPTLIAVFALVGWIFAAAFMFTVWEEDWTVLSAFYFCFNSLATIGMGDTLPKHPTMHLIMFIYIYIGLAVVSLFINLIYAKLARAYWLDLDRPPYTSIPTSPTSTSDDLEDGHGGRQQNKRNYHQDSYYRHHNHPWTHRSVGSDAPLITDLDHHHRPSSEQNTFNDHVSTSDVDLGSCVTLGILQMQDRRPMIDAIKRQGPRRTARAVQTALSLPSKRIVQVERLPDRVQIMPNVPRGYDYSQSVDDVTRLLVETYD